MAMKPEGEAQLSGLLSQLDQPAEVVHVAGAWLAEQLANDGFVWIKSRQTLQRRDGKRKEQIHLQSSKWNRTGEQIRFGSILNVRDGNLRAWRRANPTLTRRGDDWVCGHPFGNLTGSFLDGDIDISHPDHRTARLNEFSQKIRATALPWFAATRQPVNIADIPDQTIDLAATDLAELLISRGERHQAQALIPRWQALGTRHQAALTAGRELAQQGEVPDAQDRLRAFGWTTVVLGLA
jgi:hypothetical protein